ncbi:hypothetical protein SAMD00019534_052530 [Acytostelium subglobosum LB1]|uniref:hypothetical protein n=1 Tax=Acytostelium subglobosum LB1 TaxID=1410327 RepID=UPI0006450C24|nr:hypothetical protein SAMD00019534_052530 [Acytostelium subglobosum LB1]GAM22078.1 hypothetical protein SAMD00019534_052530 [Acytostelium subglobosum LB1]|eukprot:XP_012755178.1 hypothetical protein SAMD00019534_052530 [Acytostelium subglobosum LB1]
MATNPSVESLHKMVERYATNNNFFYGLFIKIMPKKLLMYPVNLLVCTLIYSKKEVLSDPELVSIGMFNNWFAPPAALVRLLSEKPKPALKA